MLWSPLNAEGALSGLYTAVPSEKISWRVRDEQRGLKTQMLGDNTLLGEVKFSRARLLQAGRAPQLLFFSPTLLIGL